MKFKHIFVLLAFLFACGREPRTYGNKPGLEFTLSNSSLAVNGEPGSILQVTIDDAHSEDRVKAIAEDILTDHEDAKALHFLVRGMHPDRGAYAVVDCATGTVGNIQMLHPSRARIKELLTQVVPKICDTTHAGIYTTFHLANTAVVILDYDQGSYARKVVYSDGSFDANWEPLRWMLVNTGGTMLFNQQGPVYTLNNGELSAYINNEKWFTYETVKPLPKR